MGLMYALFVIDMLLDEASTVSLLATEICVPVFFLDPRFRFAIWKDAYLHLTNLHLESPSSAIDIVFSKQSFKRKLVENSVPRKIYVLQIMNFQVYYDMILYYNFIILYYDIIL